MDISQRIKAIVSEIEHDTIADIGTDHAYIPIYALQSGKAARAIACDINSKPLEKAKANIRESGLENQIETRLGNGLSPLRVGEVDTVIMAGLGGMLCMDILRAGKEQVSDLSQIIVSPQSDVAHVRRFVHEIGFTVFDETMVCEENKFYHIINCHKGAEAAYTEKEYVLGKRLLDKREAVFMRFVQNEVTTLERIARRIKQGEAASKEAAGRLAEVTELLALYRDVLYE